VKETSAFCAGFCGSVKTSFGRIWNTNSSYCGATGLLLHPAILQRHGAVKHRRTGLGVNRVGIEVGDAFELPVSAGGGVFEAGFEFGGLDDFKGCGVEELGEVAVFAGISIGGFDGEESIIQAHGGVDGVAGADPVNDAFGLGAAFGFFAVARGVVVGAAKFDDVACVIFDDLLADDAEGELEAHFTTGFEAVEAIGGELHEVVGLDVKLAA